MFKLKSINKIQLGVILSILYFTVDTLGGYELIGYSFALTLKFFLLCILMSSNFIRSKFQLPQSYFNYRKRILMPLKVHVSFVIFLTLTNVYIHHFIDSSLKERIVKIEIGKAENHIKNEEKKLSEKFGNEVTLERKNRISENRIIEDRVYKHYSIGGILKSGFSNMILLSIYTLFLAIFITYEYGN